MRSANHRHHLGRSVPDKRGASRSSRTLGAGCDGRGRCRYDERQRQRTAKSRGPDIPTLISNWRDHPPVMVARKPGSPGRARRKPLKPFAQGRPIAKGVPVVTEACVSFRFARKAMGAIFAPAFPAPSVFGRRMDRASLGRFRVARRRRLVLVATSLPATNAKRLRKGAKRRSNPKEVWIASRSLLSGVLSRDPLARNDG